jgi:hypothetical protein
MWIGLSLRILSLLFVAFQAALLDWYLVTYAASTAWLAWIAADLCVLAAYLASFIYADFYFQQNHFKKLRRPQQNHTPIHRQRRHLHNQSDYQQNTDGQEQIHLDLEKGLGKKRRKSPQSNNVQIN